MTRISFIGNAHRSAICRPPVEADWLYLNFFTDPDDYKLNRIRGQQAATVVGAPVAGTGFITLVEYASYVQTKVAQPTALTLIAACRARDWVAGQTQTFWSNWNSGSSPDPAGCTLGIVNGNLRAFAPTNPAGAAVSLIADAASPVETGWILAAMTLEEVAGVSHIAAHDLTNGTKVTSSQPYPLRTSSRTFRLGSTYNSVGSDAQDVFAAAIVAGVMPDDALAAVRPWWADMAASFSIGL